MLFLHLKKYNDYCQSFVTLITDDNLTQITFKAHQLQKSKPLGQF